MEIKYIVDVDEAIIKEYLKDKGCSRNLRKYVRLHPCLYVNGQLAKNHYRVIRGDIIQIQLHEVINETIHAHEMPLDVLYEDDYFLIFNKQQPLAAHPSKKHPLDNINSVVKDYFQSHHIEANVHIVNRLDYMTTGIIIIAKSGFIHHAMSQTTIQKNYLCYIEGHIQPSSGTIDLPIRRSNETTILRGVYEDGQKAITHYQTLRKESNRSLLEIHLETGRTHQIRVHMAHMGHPLIGDALYGVPAEYLYLHCHKMEFYHPITHHIIRIIHYPSWFSGE